MKIYRFEAEGTARYGCLENEILKEFSVSPFAEGWDVTKPEYTGKQFKLSEVKVLVPCEPTQYIGIGLNMKSSADALGRPYPKSPIIFFKADGAVIATGENIELKKCENPNYLFEGELAVVIGKVCKNVKEEEALDYVIGCTCSNDCTDFNYSGINEVRLKSMDTFGPVGPCIDTDADPNNSHVMTFLNGEKIQDGMTDDYIFTPQKIIEIISSFMTLYPGDVISLGTPPGLPHLNPGDKIEVVIPEIGTLVNNVVEVE